MASSIPSGGFGLPLSSFRNLQSRQYPRKQTSGVQASSSGASVNTSRGGFGNFPVKASLTAGGLALAGDTIAQTLGKYHKRKREGKEDDVLSWLLGPHDFVRSLRMATYGALLYGPGSDWWYKFLDRLLPGKSTFSLVSKIVLNQIVLGPAVITVVFAWNYLWAGRLRELPSKYRADFASTMVDGWKFWVPAATVNFGVVPLQGRVAFMSLCSIFWNFYLSLRMMK